jgi:hypothetical protein
MTKDQISLADKACYDDGLRQYLADKEVLAKMPSKQTAKKI